MTYGATGQYGAKALRRIGAVAAFVFFVVSSGAAYAAAPPMDFSDLAKKVTPAVVYIASTHEIPGPQGGLPGFPFEFPEGSPFEEFFKEFRKRQGENLPPRRANSLGSGFIVDPAGYVVTNNHVIDGASEVTVRLEDDSEYSATVVGTDPQTDLALLKIDADRALPAVTFGDSDEAEVGNWVLAVGNPFGLGGTVTSGIISARGRNLQAGPYDDFLQIDAPINRGNSGGPLFNMDGEVIGVNTAIYSPNGGSVGIGFAIPSNMVKQVVAQLKETGSVERGWLGVSIQAVTPEIADALGLDEAYGAMVTEILPDSPASASALRQGDVVLTFRGARVEDPRDLARQVARTPVGTEAEIGLLRNGRRDSVTVVIGKRPSAERLAGASPQVRPGVFHSDALDADLAALTDDRRAELEIPEDVNGVLVLDIEDGPAFEQGLRPGDIIRQVGGEPVASPEQLESRIEAAKTRGDKAMLLMVTRQGRNLFLGLKLGMS